MFHLHLKQNLRSIGFLLILITIMSSCGLLWWVNQVGLPEPWRAAIEAEAAKQGVHLKIGSLSYFPFRGVTASDVLFFADEECERELSRIERLILNFDQTKLVRGEFMITKVQLSDARVSMPIDPERPDSEMLEMKQVNALVSMPGNRRMEVHDASGVIAGIEVELNAQMMGYQQKRPPAADRSQDGQRRRMVASVIKEIKKWQFDENSPPRIKINVQGDLNDRSSLRASVSLKTNGMHRGGHSLQELKADAELQGNLLTITSLQARDARGRLNGVLDYNGETRDGRAEISSSLELSKLLYAWFGYQAGAWFSSRGTQQFDLEASFKLDEKNRPTIEAIGKIDCSKVSLKGVLFDRISSSISWQNEKIFLRDLVLSRHDGEARAKLLSEGSKVRLSLHSTLPTAVYEPFFTHQPLGIVLRSFSARKDASVDVTLDGSFNLADRHDWSYKGHGFVKNVNYHGVPVNHANCQFAVDHHHLDFYDGTVIFNYDDYSMRRAFDGPREATAKVGRIRYVADRKMVEVRDVHGEFWAAPMVRLFAPKIADSLEVYQFHRPPQLSGNGDVDVTPQGRTNLKVDFKSPNAATYTFLGKPIIMQKPEANVEIKGPQVIVKNLSFSAFDGDVSGEFIAQGNSNLTGNLKWSELQFLKIANTYDFKTQIGGEMTGYIDFAMKPGSVSSMQGSGLLAVHSSELFSVPIFGPITPLLRGILGDKRAGSERVKDAYFNFHINQGIVRTDDFRAMASSLVFTGDGSLDLSNQMLDMTLRMNTRGLLGLITLPLRPFYGIFQFRGTGPLRKTVWENAPFTPPNEQQKQVLLDPPKAKVIDESE